MNLGQRLKQVREISGKTQKEMAKAIGTNPQTWQVYESGKSVPGGNVLEALARLHFNVNWLLTGEGHMFSSPAEHSSLIFTEAQVPGGSMADKFKLIRGELSYQEFAIKLGFILEADIKRVEYELEGIESEEVQPDWILLSCICHRFGVSPAWMIEDEGPMLKKDVCIQKEMTCQKIDADVLSEVLSDLSVYESINPGALGHPHDKASLVAALYQNKLTRFKEGKTEGPQ